MKKNLLKSMIALAAFCLGGISAYAQNQVGTAPVKMTFIDQSFPDSINGVCDTIRAGYNKAAAVGSAIGFGNTGWGANWIGVLKVDVSAIPGTVPPATLKAKISGSTDSKRTTGWGVALTDNAWSADLTYTTVSTWTVSKLLNGGNQVWTSTKAATVFEEKEWDVTEALSSGQATATLLVYETAAAGGYMTEAEVEVEYEPFEATSEKLDFEDGDVSKFVNVNTNRLTIEAVDDEVLGSKVAKFTVTSRNALPIGFYDFSELTGKATKVAIEFDFNMSSVSGHSKITIGDALVHNAENGGFNVTSKNNYGYGANGAIFYMGSDRGNLGGGNENYFKINETPAAASTLAITADQIFGQWLHAKVVVDVDDKLVSYIISNATDTLFQDGGIPFANENAQSCTEFDVSFSNTGNTSIDNLSITNYKSTAVFADYTVKYVDATGKEIKDARTGNGQVGKFVTLLDSDKAAIKTDDMKYIYESDNSAEVAIADGGTAIITVTFREAAKYYAVLNCKAGSETLKQFRDMDNYWFWEGDNFILYPSRAYKAKDGKYYFTDATDNNGAAYTFPNNSITPVTNAGKTYYIGTLDYAVVDSVAYYANFEDLALPVTDEGNGTGLGQLVGTVNSWYSFSGGYFSRFDGGRGIRLDAGSYVYTEPIAEAAAYKVSIYGRNDVSAADTNPYALGYIENGSEEIKMYNELTIAAWGSATTGWNIVEGVNIPAGAKLVIMNTNEDATSKISLDDISLTKTGEYVAPVVTGIKNIEKIQNAGVIYNLNGQVVTATKKGLYMQNGRKFVVK